MKKPALLLIVTALATGSLVSCDSLLEMFGANTNAVTDCVNDSYTDAYIYYLITEIDFKKSQKDIQVVKIEDKELTNNKTLDRYCLSEGFYSGINNESPGSGYIDFHNDNLLVLSSRGVLGYTEDTASVKGINDKTKFKQIKTNIEDFIGLEQFRKKIGFH